MSLERLLSEKRLVEYKPTEKEIQDLLELVERNLKDSRIPALSVDRKFISLYSAGQLLATIVLHINGYRTRGEAHHHTTFEAAKIFLPREASILDYFDRCRILRNKSEYERSGIVSENEIKSLRDKVISFTKIVVSLTKGIRNLQCLKSFQSEKCLK